MLQLCKLGVCCLLAYVFFQIFCQLCDKPFSQLCTCWSRLATRSLSWHSCSLVTVCFTEWVSQTIHSSCSCIIIGYRVQVLALIIGYRVQVLALIIGYRVQVLALIIGYRVQVLALIISLRKLRMRSIKNKLIFSFVIFETALAYIEMTYVSL